LLEGVKAVLKLSDDIHKCYIAGHMKSECFRHFVEVTKSSYYNLEYHQLFIIWYISYIVEQ